MKRDDLVVYLDDLLRIGDFADYGPQGLQVEGRGEIKRITLSVDAALPALEGAVQEGSDLHLVHHGIFWGGEQRLVGALGKRVRTLMKNDINLYACHLALDAHPQLGNNAILAKMLGLSIVDWWAESKGNLIGVIGEVPAEMGINELVALVSEQLEIKVLASLEGPQLVKRVGVVSGSAANQIAEAAKLGIDTFVTGETSHAHYWDPAEYGVNVIYAGHYATETVGIRALGDHLAEALGLETQFLDHPTGL